MRVEADKSVQHVAHESSRAACEEMIVNGKRVAAYGNSASRERGVLPKGTRYVPGMRVGGSIAFASVYDQAQMSEAGRIAPATIPFYLERRLEGGAWITDNGWGKTRVDAETGAVSGLTLAMARGLAKGHADYRVVMLAGWDEQPDGITCEPYYLPDGETARTVPKEPTSRQAATKGKKGAAGMW